ncbi:UDP-2,4-diacetamido-2,4,6-trideoxy-beta-L-altropyranose hydrolase [Paenibacillus sp. Marseille-Q9583]
MKYFIRADASEQLGVGHVMRCLALSKGLIDQKQEVIFICRDVDPFISELIKGFGCFVLQFETEFPLGSVLESTYIIQLIGKQYTVVKEDWLIIDHYSLDFRFEVALRNLFTNIMVIDDLADRVHDCNVLLDTSLDDSKKNRYSKLIPHTAIKLLGPEYALLRQEFADVRETLVFNHRESVKNIFVCFGGTDPTNETLKIIRALEPFLNSLAKVKIILGKTNPHAEKLKRLYEKNTKLEFLIQPDSIAIEMSSCDLAICAGGSMTWERYCLGLPGIVIAIAENQVELAQQSHLLALDEFVGLSSLIEVEDVTRVFKRIINSKEWIRNFRQKAMMVVDGKGVSRVVDLLIMKENAIELRNIGQDDVLWMWECRNEIVSRNNSFHTAEISFSEHIEWVKQSEFMLTRKLMVACIGEQKIAVVRFDRDGNDAMISLNVAKEHRGKGYALKILRELEVKALEWDRNIHNLHATIKMRNIISIKTFTKAGYKQFSNDDEIIIMKKKITF